MNERERVETGAHQMFSETPPADVGPVKEQPGGACPRGEEADCLLR